MLEDYMDFVAWLDRVLFPDDLAKDLERLGLPATEAIYRNIEFRQYNKQGTFKFTKLWQDFCVGKSKQDQEICIVFKKLIKEYRDMWLRYKIPK